MPTSPNLLFVTTDHQRADSLFMTQAGIEVTPHLNRLARESVNFTRAYTTCPLCAPARTALATGLYPTTTGVTWNEWAGTTAREGKPLHQHLAEAGYDLAHAGMQHVTTAPKLHERVKFSLWLTDQDHGRHLKERGLANWPADDMEGFKRPILETRFEGQPNPTHLSFVRTAEWPNDEAHFKDLWIVEQALAYLESRRAEREKPFALFVNIWAPHPPLWVPHSWWRKFDRARLDLPPNVGLEGPGEPANRRKGVAGQLGAGVPLEQWREVWGAHLDLVHMADALIGRLWAKVRDLGVDDRTALAFMSDHGDHLGQHAKYQKMEMYEPAARVPLFLRLPGVAPSVIDGPVSHLHVMPTLLEALGQKAPEGLHARSLYADCRAGRLAAEEPVFGQFSGCGGIGDLRRMIVLGPWKYIYDPCDRAELYHVLDDPLELANRAGEPGLAGLQRDLHARLKAWHEAKGDFVKY
ncbi:MAG: sulfatase-like hydrolase/transferase [Planctomycetota bacterium]|nr:sulfatase-like hydrolase/transferase [Planctomycetota bacterium]